MESVVYSLRNLKRLSGFPYPLAEIGLMVNHFTWHKNSLIERYFICFSFNKEKYNSPGLNLCPSFGIIPPGTVLNSTVEIRHDELFFSYSREVSQKLKAVFDPLPPERRHCEIHLNAEFKQNLEKVQNLVNARMTVGNADLLDLLAMQMVFSAFAERTEFVLESGDSAVDMRIQEIALHLKQGEKLKNLLRRYGFSRRAFYYEWKRNFSVSPKQMLRDFKLEKAQKLLIRTSHSIAEIAQECGFSSHRYFHECFLRYYHCTPGEYRRRGGGFF